MESFKYKDLTQRIIGCAMRVHGEMGNGFQEVIYQRCLAIELKDDCLEFRREQEMPLFYHNREVGSRRVDFLVEGKVLVELKAVSELNSIHMAQVLNYLKAYKMEVALLLNFGTPSLEFKR
ncbi:MAG: GxxExxY protein, partial [Chitinispirillaceae bacterium]